MPTMGKVRKAPGGSAQHSKSTGHNSSKPQKKRNLGPPPPPQRGGVELVDPRVQEQLKTYDEALSLFHQQKFARAKQGLEEVLKGPSKELADRARVHLKIAEQRMKPTQEHNPRGAEDHYQRGVAMMNIGRFVEALPRFVPAPDVHHGHAALVMVFRAARIVFLRGLHALLGNFQMHARAVRQFLARTFQHFFQSLLGAGEFLLMK